MPLLGKLVISATTTEGAAKLLNQYFYSDKWGVRDNGDVTHGGKPHPDYIARKSRGRWRVYRVDR